MEDSVVPGGLSGDDSARLLHNVEAEMALIGAMLMRPELWLAVGATVTPEMFADAKHQIIWAGIAAMNTEGLVADPLTLLSRLGAAGPLDAIGGGQYLAKLAASVPSLQATPTYAGIVRDLYVRRSAVAICQQAVLRLEQGDPDAKTGEVLDDASREIDNLSLIGGSRSTVSIAAAADVAMAAAEAAYKSQGKTVGVQTGFVDVDRLVGGLLPGMLYIIAGRPSMGKEQPVDTPTLTPAGWRPLGDLRIGDLVIGRDGRPTRVIGRKPQGTKPAYRLTFWDGSTAESGLEHLWAVAPSSGRGRKQFQVLSLAEIMRRGIAAPKKSGRFGAKWRVPVVAPVEFAPQADLPIDPYALGVLIGDGALSRRELRFSNPDFDGDIRGRMAAAMGRAGVELRENRSGACPYFDLRGPGRPALRSAIAALGLNVKSPAKFIPPAYKTAAPSARLALLRGLMDTDGGVMGGSSCFFTTSAALAEDVVFLVRSLGGVSKIRRYDRAHQGKPTEYVVVVQLADCPFLTERKAKRWRPRPISRYIWAVEYARDVEQVCIRVEAPDGLYVTRDFIVTHNSAYAIWMAHAVATAGLRVHFVSAEMTEEQCARRLIGPVAGIPPFDLQRGEIPEGGFPRLIKARATLERLWLTIDDTPSPTTSMLRASCQRQDRKGRALNAKAAQKPGLTQTRVKELLERPGIDLVIVDHLGKIKASAEAQKHGPTHAVGEVSGSLKELAKQLNVPVIALCQLNRAVEARDEKRPGLSDLRQSGEIEQDADIVAFVYREAYYLERRQPIQREGEDAEKYSSRVAAWQHRLIDMRHVAELVVAKNRDGPTGIARLHFNDKMMRFTNLATGGLNGQDQG